MITVIVNLTGIILIGAIVWWFIMTRPKARIAENDMIDIRVRDGVYDPAVLKAPRGKTLKLRFIREDASPCSEYVIFDKLNISAQLPHRQPRVISVQADHAGEYVFTCQMGMYRGKLIIE